MPIFGTISQKRKLTAPAWYGISARSFFPRLDPSRYLELLLQTSADIVQWREKDLPAELLRPLLHVGAGLASQTGKIFVVNSATWPALLGGADGVHLTAKGSVSNSIQARTEAGRPEFLIGKSVHAVEEAVRAASEGADYVILGPVFDPLSKSPERPPLGVEALRAAVERVQIPVFALGGIDRRNAALVLQTGVAGVAGISWVKEEIKGF